MQWHMQVCFNTCHSSCLSCSIPLTFKSSRNRGIAAYENKKPHERCVNKDDDGKSSQHISRAAQYWAAFDRRGAIGLALSLALLAAGGGSQPVSAIGHI